MQWTEYNACTKRIRKQSVPTSNITAETVTVDGFVVSQSDHAGITSTQTRQYTASGMTLTQTDGRGNTTTTMTDKAGRSVSVTDAANNTTTTAYCTDCDQPATITNAQGKETHYRYDLRGRKVGEWGTAVQPALFAYDDADRLVSLTTFRAIEGDVTTDPTDRTDGDTTQWAYDDASDMELTKTYADGSTITKTYDVFGRLATETNARGMVKTLAYDAPTGQLIGIGFSDVDTPGQTFEYNVQGQLTQVTDAAGTRTLSYNEYGELATDSLVAGGKTHLITENRDAYGRSSGYTYAKAGSTQQTVSYAYGEDGRMASAGFRFGNADKLFTYGYLAGSNLLQTLTMPNGMSLTQEFETQRDLLTAMLYKRGTTSVVERHYTYDSLGRPFTRSESRKGSTRNDAFTHNDRSELTAATLGSAEYSYAYDNIGNRKTAQENAEEATAYTANNLNQYTAVGEFVPEFDADGNQTKVQTSTGIWNVTYNAENRPTVFSRENANGSTTRVTCAYDYMGRRTTKKVETITTNAETEESTASTTLNQRYLYRGYLQVACCDLTRSAHPCLWLITWDPTQPVATRPLAIQKDATWYCYGWDLTKNICEIFGSDGYIKTVYSYAPFGAVTSSGSVTQPIQWSSEFYDEETQLCAYHSRNYASCAGRWNNRDAIGEKDFDNLYCYAENSPIINTDYLGYLNIQKSVERTITTLEWVKTVREMDYSYEGGPIILGIIPVPPAYSWRLDFAYAAHVRRCCCKQKEIRWMAEVEASLFGYIQVGLMKSKYVLSGSKEERAERRARQRRKKLRGPLYEPTKGAQEAAQQLELYKFRNDDALEACPTSFAFVHWKVDLEATMTLGAYYGAYAYIGTSISRGEELSWKTLQDNFDATAGFATGVYGFALQAGIRGTVGVQFTMPF